METIKWKFRWMSPFETYLPHKITRWDQVEELLGSMLKYGWDLTQPALVGYQWGDSVQLLTGTHRCAAARLAGIEVPVVIYNYWDVQKVWGTDDWQALINSGNDILP